MNFHGIKSLTAITQHENMSKSTIWFRYWKNWYKYELLNHANQSDDDTNKENVSHNLKEVNN